MLVASVPIYNIRILSQMQVIRPHDQIQKSFGKYNRHNMTLSFIKLVQTFGTYLEEQATVLFLIIKVKKIALFKSQCK